MVKTGQNGGMTKTPDITSVGFNPPRDTRLNVEAMSIEDLRMRAPHAHFEKLQRADFFRLIGVMQGHTSPMVDFSNFAAQVGNWLLVRPGQVFRYDFSHPWSGWLLVFRPDGLAAAGSNHSLDEFDLLRRVEDLASLHTLNGDQHEWMNRCLRQMQRDGKQTDDVPLRNELLRLQLAATLLRLSLWQSTGPRTHVDHTTGYGNYRRFRQLLDAHFASQHQLQHYAQALGMSERTLSRVCVAATGTPAKTVINQRLVLEAKRMLAHTALAVQSIGHALGFEDPTNFVKFFRKETAMTPLAFRREVRWPDHTIDA